MFLQLFGVASGLFNAISYIPYILDIIHHKTKPVRSAWLIWTILSIIAFFSQLAKGATDSLWLTGLQMVGLIIVFIISLKYGSGGFAKKDYIALGIASFGLLGWYFTKEPAIALFISIVINAIGAFLTIHKTYADPESETLITWIIGSLSGLLAIIAVGSMDMILLSYPLYICISNLAIVGAVLLGRRKRKVFAKKKA